MLADLVTLNRDPVTCPPSELPSLRVEATMVGGRWTYFNDGIEDSIEG
jgi:predicted amidohydrolase YtcJ